MVSKLFEHLRSRKKCQITFNLRNTIFCSDRNSGLIVKTRENLTITQKWLKITFTFRSDLAHRCCSCRLNSIKCHKFVPEAAICNGHLIKKSLSHQLIIKVQQLFVSNKGIQNFVLKVSCKTY